MPPRHAFSNTTKIDTVYNTNNRTWQGIHDSITTAKNCELFETDFIVQDDHSQVDSTRVNIQINKHCMTELLLLDNTKVLCLFDTGSNVNLTSESVIKSSEYLSSSPILDFPDYTITNTTGEINANKFIELCFRVKDDFILTTTALVVPHFGSVKFMLSISSMNHLNSVIDLSSRQISIHKKIFVFKTSFRNKVKAHNTMTIGIKCSLPKQLKNGDFDAMDGSSAMCSLSKSACPISHMLGIVPHIAHSSTYQNPYTHTPQSYDYPTCAESLHMSKHCHHHEYQNNPHSNEFIDNQHELMMKDYYSHNQDKMSPAQIRELKVKTFHYLSHDDFRLSMSDRNIIRKVLNLDTDSVLLVMINNLFMFSFTPCANVYQPITT